MDRQEEVSRIAEALDTAGGGQLLLIRGEVGTARPGWPKRPSRWRGGTMPQFPDSAAIGLMALELALATAAVRQSCDLQRKVRVRDLECELRRLVGSLVPWT